MIGYHDCPPHPCETLDKERDAQWIRAVDASIERRKPWMRPWNSDMPYHFWGGLRVK